MHVASIKVNGDPAGWRRDGDELIIRPRHGLPQGDEFVVVVRYSGVPETINDAFGESGFLHTDDGALVIGEPHVAATWFPVNDHPLDKAAYDFRITVPRGLQVVANGILMGHRNHDGWSSWKWHAAAPMNSYLAGMGIGKFMLRSYRADGIRYWDAIDPDLLTDLVGPRTGTQFAITQQADSSYKRLSRVIDVPAGGAQLSFWAARDTEPGWDHFFVEAHTVGMDDWTTLPDGMGHNNQDTGAPCPGWLGLHPFLEHYQTAVEDPGPDDPLCEPSGTTGDWWAASGASEGWEQWTIDLSAWAGASVEVALSYASDESVQLAGVFIDDVVVSTGAGTTSFEDDGDVMDGWTVPGAPAGSPGNDNDWKVGTIDDAPPTLGEKALTSLDRQPEIIAFESSIFGDYPFNAAGGIVDDYPIGFALENQTRPIYSFVFFFDQIGGDFVIVHELAHQWFGDYVAVHHWRDIWLNEGFATYAEWLWSEREGFGTVQDNFDFWYDIAFGDPEDPFWDLVIGDPGPVQLFDFPVYIRGAMTLQQLRLEVGDGDFFRILRQWVRLNAGANGSTREFIRLSEKISGKDLGDLFDTWLFTPGKPELPGATSSHRAGAAVDMRDAPLAAQSLMQRLKAGSKLGRN